MHDWECSVIRIAAVGLISWLLVVSSRPVLAGDTTVTVEPWGATQTHFFDPAKPAGAAADPNTPGDLPGPPVDAQGAPILKPDEAGAAVYKVDASYRYRASGAGGKVTITHVDAVVSGSAVIHLPSGATQQLTDHENGHVTLYRDEYLNSAQKKVLQSIANLVGSQYATNAEADAAIKNALKTRGTDSVTQQMDVSVAKFDRVTNKGKNDLLDPATGKPVDTPAGIAMTKAEWAKAPAAGRAPGRPADDKPQAATAPDPARVFFDPATSKLAFAGDLQIRYASGAFDPITGRGVFQIDPLIAIGPLEGGGTHLSDTEIRIVDEQSGDSLLAGYLLQVACMASSLPDFPGMIQGFLDIPPDFAQGISNTIESDFLARLKSAAALGEQTTFWFFADQPLFDGQGNSLIPRAGVSGSMKIGVIPEAATLLLVFAACVAALLAGRFRATVAVSLQGLRPRQGRRSAG
ncbi:MAG: hypothetical protein RKP46_13600 [Candidatus Accumulibacter sp.]|uniref:hypothetical protein n=1 Tax=Accumulibacter sp. TaxID=2053492 RepID=UPI00287A5D25|nr:hypothetical protein [Accumulibacter sp.]MDS4015360.1 hypothetical protein [Accumulibacter sp.]